MYERLDRLDLPSNSVLQMSNNRNIFLVSQGIDEEMERIYNELLNLWK